jgi:trehalose synthase-fused probable maltokinase
MVQELVASTGDGWGWMLGRLTDQPDGPADALLAVAEIGRLTAGMHAALASRPDRPGFPARRATGDELAAWRRSALVQLDAALMALTGEPRDRLARVAPRIAEGLEGIPAGGATRVSRIHGDYHLGQLLRTADGFRVIDFEGEPARSLAERQAPASPLRDLAGMLRSLDYAAHTAIAVGPESLDRADWLSAARAALLDGYGGISPDDAPLLAAFEIEKACYEVAYETNNRPDWVWLPLGALERQILSG